MAEEKTYVFGESANNGILGLLGPMLSQRGVDPNVLLAMQGRNNDGFGEGGWFIWVIFLFFLMGWGGNGFGNNGAGGLGNQLNNDYGREMLLQAINGNGNAISQLATTLNCDINAVQSAINSVQSQIQSVGNQVGMSGQQIINAIQAGNCQIASQIASCCCDVRTAIERQGYEGQLATLNQTNTLGSKIDQQTTLISDKFCQLEMRELQNKIDALREDKSALINQLSQEHQTNAIQAFQAQTIAPVNAALQDLSARLGAIECKQPATVTIPYIPAMGNLVPVSYSQPVNFSVNPYTTLANGKPEEVTLTPKSELEQLFRNYGIKVDNCVGYDVMYVYHMAKSDFFESSIISEQYLLQFVKDYLDDIDGYDGKALTRFYADCIGSGTPIMWEDMI